MRNVPRLSCYRTAPTPRPPPAHLMQIRGERSKVTMGQAGTLLQPGHKLSWVQGGQRINNINIYTGIVISASHSLDLISRAPHPSTVLTVSFLPAVAGRGEVAKF